LAQRGLPDIQVGGSRQMPPGYLAVGVVHLSSTPFENACKQQRQLVPGRIVTACSRAAGTCRFSDALPVSQPGEHAPGSEQGDAGFFFRIDAIPQEKQPVTFI